MKPLFRSGLTALGLLLAVLRAQADNVTFCYHQFDHSLQHLYAVLPEVLEWQIQYLKSQGISFIRLADLEANYAAPDQPFGRTALLTVDDGVANVQQVLPILAQAQAPMTLFIYPTKIDHDPFYLTSEQLRNLSANPWLEFGSHSTSHPVMRNQNPEQLQREVVQSKLWLEQQVGRTVTAFAYPFGMSDATARASVKEHYSLAFGVNDAGNGATTDPYQLNRFVIYKTTAFGEFMDDVQFIQGRRPQRGYTVRSLGIEQGDSRYFIFVRGRIYKFPDEERPRTLLILPNSDIGPGWVHRLIRLLKDSPIQTYALVNRNNNVPFYRPEKEMRSLAAWGLKDYLEDLRLSLDHVKARAPRITVLTWGDGFDLLLAALAQDPSYRSLIQGVVVINPSWISPDGTGFLQAMEHYDQKLLDGGYAEQSLKYFMKIKTLADLAILKPQAESPFGLRLNHPGLTNRALFMKVMDEEAHPDLTLDFDSREYDFADFQEAFMQPLPLFSMAVPVRWLRDLNDLWLKHFVLPELNLGGFPVVDFPVAYFYSPEYQPNVKRCLQVLKTTKTPHEYSFDELSTIEIMLSHGATGMMKQEVERMCNEEANGRPAAKPAVLP